MAINKPLSDPDPDPADRGVGHLMHVSDHHLGYVLPQEYQADHHLLVQLDPVLGEIDSPPLGDVVDAGHDLPDHISGKTCSGLITHQLLS